MKKISIADKTVRECLTQSAALSFREKIEAAKILDKLGIDVIELPAVQNEKSEMLLYKTIAESVKNSALSIRTGLTQQSCENAWSCAKYAAKPILSVALPVSPVQMEYVLHLKPAKVIEKAQELIKAAKSECQSIEFVAIDATRADPEFLFTLIKTAIEAGATKITVCDDAGNMLPVEFSAFISEIIRFVPEICDLTLCADISDKLSVSAASAFEAVKAGANEIKTVMGIKGFLDVKSIVNVIGAKGEDYNLYTSVNTSALGEAAEKLSRIIDSEKSAGTVFETRVDSTLPVLTLDKNDDLSTLIKAVNQLGYELSEEDYSRVYDAFIRVAEKKDCVGTKELDAIVASVAMQVPATYHLVSYVINSGNIITATANLCIEKDGKRISGVAAGDGPVDAAFLAIEQIIGHHFELDDFQIQAVTEGHEAMGSSVVKLRSATGRLYSGNGISTDIIGASIRAYISALNKIAFEEKKI